MNRYKASTQLEQFIMCIAPPHYPSADAPSTLDGLLALPTGPIPVYDGGCEKTIYSSPTVNHAFRAWHDQLHIRLRAEFDMLGELRITEQHLYELRAFAPHYAITLSEEDRKAIFFDVLGQTLYAERHGGAFPDDQAAFVQACFERGVVAACSDTF